MTFRTLVFAYLAGGLTFLPLLFAAVIAAGWYLLPKIDSVKSSESTDEGVTRSPEAGEALKKADEARKRQDSFGETAASGTFAVVRQYDFQAAMSALNARNSASGGANGSATTDGGASAEGSSGATSESVYQSMYRSVFVGNRNASSSSLLHDEDSEQSAGPRRKAVPANVMHIILRHGHLMLYDSPAHVDVKYVISLAHHNISLQAAKDGDDADETKILEPDLFTKRTAIVLTPVDLPNGAMQQPFTQKAAKPFYLFCATNIEKEDFYRALLYTRTHPPTPRPLDTDALIKLQSALHSSLLTPETRALNALMGRVFLGVHKTDRLVDFLRSKIERKMARIQKPSFIPIVEIRSIDLGDAAPVYSNLKLRDLNISGDTTISADVRYNGGLSITILAVAKLDLGSRFKTRTVDLVLKTSMQRISGTMLLHIKSAPTNRMWFCFESMPEIEIRVEPVVSERKITYGFVLRAIEERVRAAFGEGLVKPNWDDIPMPLQDTRGSHARGSLWLDEGDEEHVQQRPDAARIIADRNEKTMSTPALVQDDTASSTGLSSNSEINITKLRHSATLPVSGRDSKRRVDPAPNSQGTSPEQGPLPPKPLRSPSITTMSPSVAMDDQTVEPVRSGDASLRQISSQKGLWRSRGMGGPTNQQKDAAEGLRDLQARDEQAAGRALGSAGSGDEATSMHSDDREDVGSARSMHIRGASLGSIGSDSTLPATPRSLSRRSTESEQSTAATSLASSAKAQQLQQRKANILAAAGAATNAAKNWGWNAYQKNKGAFQRGAVKLEPGAVPNEPMGRGQPLPPPGQPLPGPNKTLWGNMSAMKRKPVPNLPPRPTQSSTEGGEAVKQSAEAPENGAKVRPMSMTEDEFGNWHENSGNLEEDTLPTPAGSDNSQQDLAIPPGESVANEMTPAVAADESDEKQPEVVQPQTGTTKTAPAEDIEPKKVPPPLPTRRDANVAGIAASFAASRSTSIQEAQNAPENEPQSDDSEPTALRVPEYAAEAIAAENVTPGLALGAPDDAKHVDVSRGVNAEVLPNITSDDLTRQGDVKKGDPLAEVKDADKYELKRTTTEERFARGEDVTEKDFDHHDERLKESDSVQGVATNEGARATNKSAG